MQTNRLLIHVAVLSFLIIFNVAFDVYGYTLEVVNPSDDGYITSSGYVNTNTYLMPDDFYGGKRGIVEFSMQSISSYSGSNIEFLLSVNPYATPLGDKTIELYGYESADGILTATDYNSGVFLGIWTLPDNLTYREDAFFDVTGFLNSVTSSYVGFNLRTEYADVFSSLEYNYGHPSQITVNLVPEPISSTLFIIGSATLGFRRFRRK
jgi:hypothetical protein